MAWWRVQFGAEPDVGEVSQAAFMNAIDKAIREEVPPNTIASRKSRVYLRHDADGCVIIVPPEVAMVARATLNEFEAQRLGDQAPPLTDFKEFAL